MSKVSNAIFLLKILESGRIYKISDLASMIECSNRAIRTYKEDLEKAGVYIESVKGRYGGYYCPYIKENGYFNLNKIDLNNLENLYLNLKSLNIEDLSALERTIEKLRYSLIFDKTSENKIKDYSDDYNYISNAINKNLKLEIYYKKNKICFIPHSVYVNLNNYFVTGIHCKINQIRTYNLNDIKIIKNK